MIKMELRKIKIITLCGSSRFEDDFHRINSELTLEGNIVLSLGVWRHQYKRELFKEETDLLDLLHYMRIDMSDAIYVVNKDGYMGESTKKEIMYAKMKGKEVYYMEEIV